MCLSDKRVIERTAILAIECGLGGARCLKGKPLHIYHGAPAYPLMLEIAKQAYAIGARRVDPTTWSPTLDALHVTHATDKALIDIPKHWGDRWNDLVDVRGATIRIEGVDNPLALSKCDSEKVAAFNRACKAARDKFYTQGLETNRTPWCIVPFATEGWAKMVFPNLDPTRGRRRLQAALVKIMELDKPDFVDRWWKRGEKIKARGIRLDSLRIKRLIFTGPGTNLVVGLNKKARFHGGPHAEAGRRQFQNMPTFENFTTPDKYSVNGTVTTTRPVLINGQLVEGLEVTFESGKVVSFKARKGQKAFAAMLRADEGASYLGEVALVGIDDSPIFDTGIVFRNTLLDENAACHIAFGFAYPDCLVGGTKMSSQQKNAVGCNQSKVHHDCMISDANTLVEAELYDGTRMIIIKDGAWYGDFAG